jgi:hypothetical protein
MKQALKGISPIAVIVGVVSLIAIAVALVLGLGFEGLLDSSHIGVVVSVIGSFAPTIAAILALLKVDKVRDDIRNGPLHKSVTEATKTAIDDKRQEGAIPEK